MRLVSLKFFIFILAIFLLILFPGAPVTTIGIVIRLLALLVFGSIFYFNVLDELVYKANLYREAEPEYVESLARYRGTLNSSHGLPKGWVITYDNSLDKHEFMETGEKGDDNLSFIVNLRESGYLQVEGTPTAPQINFYPKNALSEQDQIKIKVLRNGETIYSLGYTN